MSILDGLSPGARKLYDVMSAVAERGICRRNQRELIAATGVAFKTLIVQRDELVAAGLIDRIDHYRGRRDWYKIRPVTEVERERERAVRELRRASTLEDLREQASRELQLFEV